jgi:hypothetical protein
MKKIKLTMKSKYLYGASVQGIQNFIFETNKLSEIARASELVEQICTNLFEECVGANTFNDDNLIIGAAGNIKYIFESEDQCQHFVSSFPRIIMNAAPGITISQAVVKFEKDNPDITEINKLEERLRIQKNRYVAQHGLGLMISERSRKTGKIGVQWNKKDEGVIDISQQKKENNKSGSKKNLLEKILGKDFRIKEENYPNDIKEILAEKPSYNWIAVVHADGNNLGKLLLEMSEKLEPQEAKKAFKEFSELLDEATVKAASNAYYDEVHGKFKRKLPLRPVILGGDDLTVIIRGDLALPFTTSFLSHFEKETQKKFSGFASKYKGLKGFEKGLTACAGIAYIKSNYPFHYGAELCEELCTHSKNIAKNINKDSDYTPSCLTFHKVHSSFINDYKDIIKEELTAGTVQFNNGPYFIKPQDNYNTIGMLNKWVETIKLKDAPKAPLRNWVSELQVNTERAAQQLDRIKQINTNKFISKLNIDNPLSKREVSEDGIPVEKDFTHIFDVLTIATIQA